MQADLNLGWSHKSYCMFCAGSYLELLLETIYATVLPASVAQLDAPSNWRPGGRGFNPAEVGNILSWRLIVKYFLRSFSPFR